MMKFYLESLGCPKNLVDSHGMSRQLQRAGYVAVGDPRQAHVLIVNTCGFIEDARDESIGELQDLALHKRDDQILIASGCLAQLWGEALVEAAPGVDALLGTRRWNEIDRLVKDLLVKRNQRPPTALAWLGDPVLVVAGDGLQSAQQGASAYLRIADGCSASCAFCTIPFIKGPASSRPAASIVREAVELVQQGVKEIVLIAQDTTVYGHDRGERDALPDLIRAILEAVPRNAAGGTGSGLQWLRLMYAYPGHISPHLVEVMADDPRICHYLDLPLQHAHPDVLKRMKRPANVGQTRRLIDDLRAAMPGIALRTSFIVGYPGETEQEFEALCDFVSEICFDRVGGFLFSPEEGTVAATLPERVPTEIQLERLERLMSLQQTISRASNQAQIGRTLDILIEGQGDGLSIGRSYRDAPEIDGLVLVPVDLPVNEMVPVQITGAMEYDLIGQPEEC